MSDDAQHARRRDRLHRMLDAGFPQGTAVGLHVDDGRGPATASGPGAPRMTTLGPEAAAVVRKRLGLPADADGDQVYAALMAATENSSTPTAPAAPTAPTPGPVPPPAAPPAPAPGGEPAAPAPGTSAADDVVTISRGVLEELQAAATPAGQAERRTRAHAEEIVDAAIRRGAIAPAARAAWLATATADPQAGVPATIEATLRSIPNSAAVPLEPIGHAGTGQYTGSTDAIRADPAYQDWTI